ncbi:MAG TPA: hypothetical protein VNV42_16265 [Solirubrobacteraceae bacterium]|jgi:hypothetical protein|nr:hypothetical protein [Solirubrobacteraceae bacterium]
MRNEKMVDPLAIALFGVVRDLPADERYALLGVIDHRLRRACDERVQPAEQVTRQGRESQRPTASGYRDKPRTERCRQRLLPSSSTTHAADSPGRSRSRTTRTSTSAAASVRRQNNGGSLHKRPTPSDDEILEELRRCSSDLSTEFGYDEYRIWALAQQATNPDSPALLIDVGDLIRRFGSLPRARIAAGLEQVPRRLAEKDNEGSFSACVSAVQAAADDIGRTRILSVSAYMQWRSMHLEDKQRGRALAPPPEWKIISDRFGTWPRALSAAGLISPQEATDYHGGEDERVSDAHIARWLCVVATELGTDMAMDAYGQWRQKQIDDPKAGYPPGQHDVQERFGSWDLAVQATDTALKTSNPFEYIMGILRARNIAR